MKPKDFLHPLLLVDGTDSRLVNVPRPVTFAVGPLFDVPYGWATEQEGNYLIKRSGGPGRVYRWAYDQPRLVYERLNELEAAQRGEILTTPDKPKRRGRQAAGEVA
jgi:hypothetical protein